MPTDDHRYWFRAKRFGWGWGLPCAWQGWVALTACLLVALAAPAVFGENSAATPVTIVVAIGVLIVICAAKGEPPSWRWGRR